MGEDIFIDDIPGTESFLEQGLPHMVLLAKKCFPHSKKLLPTAVINYSIAANINKDL